VCGLSPPPRRPTENPASYFDLKNRGLGLPLLWQNDGFGGVVRSRSPLGPARQLTDGVVDDGNHLPRQLREQVLPQSINIRACGAMSVVDNRLRGGPGLVENALGFDSRLGTPGACRILRLRPQLIGLGPRGGQNLLLASFQLGLTVIELPGRAEHKG
jgi:hypothetical protein